VLFATAKEIGLIPVSTASYHVGTADRHSVFVWESDGTNLFQKCYFTNVVNRNVEVLVRKLYAPDFEDVAWRKDAQFIFFIWHTFV